MPMWGLIIMVLGLTLSIYELTQYIRQRKHPQKKKDASTKKNVSRKRNNERYYINKNDDGEMTEEQMIAEDYYFYRNEE